MCLSEVRTILWTFRFMSEACIIVLYIMRPQHYFCWNTLKCSNTALANPNIEPTLAARSEASLQRQVTRWFQNETLCTRQKSALKRGSPGAFSWRDCANGWWIRKVKALQCPSPGTSFQTIAARNHFPGQSLIAFVYISTNSKPDKVQDAVLNSMELCETIRNYMEPYGHVNGTVWN